MWTVGGMESHETKKRDYDMAWRLIYSFAKYFEFLNVLVMS